MTSEEIIQRLLDQKKISAKEAMIILKDLAKIGYKSIIGYPIEEPYKDYHPYQFPPYTVMYGVTPTTSPYYGDDYTLTYTTNCKNANSN